MEKVLCKHKVQKACSDYICIRQRRLQNKENIMKGNKAYFIMKKGSVYWEDPIVLNEYASNEHSEAKTDSWKKQ